MTAFQVQLLDPIFFFARETVNGRIRGFENYKIQNALNLYGQRVKPSDAVVSNELFSAFMSFIGRDPKWKKTLPKAEKEQDFIKLRLRYNLVMAAFGSVSANQVLTEADPQVAKAVESLPNARLLAQTARKVSPNK